MATVDLTSDTDDQNEYRHDGANKRSRVDLSATSSCSSSSTSIPPALPSKEMCDICADEFTADDDLLWQVLRCKHKLCTACFCILSKTGSSMSGRSLSYCKCPFCNAVDGIEFGTCPDGTMTVTREKRALPGHPGCDTIVIEYRITESPYNELRNAFLPDDTEGQRVLELLKKAWDRRLIMALGHSATRNQSNIPVWNVHHKTARNGGPPCYGYPDPTYLARVTQELRERGVV